MASPTEDAGEAPVHPDAPVGYFLCVWSLSSAGKQALTCVGISVSWGQKAEWCLGCLP